uniref:ShKT domain-containing protein n=1 Tax=Acrobeloides nanus TaxID=290746 RepID=A0A914E616_9BILA
MLRVLGILGNGNNQQNYNPYTQRRCLTSGCYDANMCCPLWKLRGMCQTDPVGMNCNCRVSCGFCSVTNYRDPSDGK